MVMIPQNVKHNGWTLVLEYYDPSDSFYHAMEDATGKTSVISFTRHQSMSAPAFAAYVDLGFPANENGFWTNETLLDALKNAQESATRAFQSSPMGE